MTLEVQYQSEDFALLTDWDNPYTSGTHGDWRPQVRHALSRNKNHIKLHEKLCKYGKFILVYSKIKESKATYLSMAGYPDATVCVISSSGEHLLTPWMIIHNIGHTMISYNMRIKKDIMKIIGLTSHDDSIIDIQQSLVNCRSSRDKLIPNVNELIYELFTTFVWFGVTKSDKKELVEYCNLEFSKLIENHIGKMFWHKYRHPIEKHPEQDWLKNLLDGIDKFTHVPGVPGFTSKVLKTQHL